jgi:hypothetical protein
MPVNVSRLRPARSAPRRDGGQAAWKYASSGTSNMPAPKPSTQSIASAVHQAAGSEPEVEKIDRELNARHSDAAAMITAPTGTRPMSAPRDEIRPATTLPTAMPATSETSIGIESDCDVAPASLTNWSTLSWVTAPSAQKKTMPAAEARSSRDPNSSRRSDQVRDSAFHGGGAAESAAGRRSISRLAIQPATATPSSATQAGRSRPHPANSPPGRCPHQSTAAATATISSSANLHQAITAGFAQRSASQPASQASATKGSTKPAVPTVSTRATPAAPAACLPRPIASQRSRLSLTTVSVRTASSGWKPRESSGSAAGVGGASCE